MNSELLLCPRCGEKGRISRTNGIYKVSINSNNNQVFLILKCRRCGYQIKIDITNKSHTMNTEFMNNVVRVTYAKFYKL